MVQPRLGDILLPSYTPRVIKGKGLPLTCYGLRDLLTALLDGGAWSTPLPGRFAPGKKRLGGSQHRSVRCGEQEISCPTEVRTPNGSARKELLYRPRFAAPQRFIR